ncbi:MAG TPA: hypothetical protein PKY59_12430 [Pyrinomonadaceae bacterium]|nr:hypothetical protein [Pyrinomonadaceae bacterium]
MQKFNITANQIFTVENKLDWRFGKTFVVIGFQADKFGKVFAVCEDLSEKGYKSSYIFFAEDFA